MNFKFYTSLSLVLCCTGCEPESNFTECNQVATRTGKLSNQEYSDFIWGFYMKRYERDEYKYFYHPPFGDEKNLYLHADCSYLNSLYEKEFRGLFLVRDMSAKEFDVKRRQMNPTRAEYEEQFGKVEFE